MSGESSVESATGRAAWREGDVLGRRVEVGHPARRIMPRVCFEDFLADWQVKGLGGDFDRLVAMRIPVVVVDCHAGTLGGRRPPRSRSRVPAHSSRR